MNRAIEIVKHFESCKLTAYQDSVGVWTIGWGTTAAAGLGIAPKAGMKITQEQADNYLDMGFYKFLGKMIPLLHQPASAHELGAMNSLAYNIGVEAFAKSTLLKKFNSGDKAGAAEEFLRWNKAGGKVLRGLTRRRKSERHLFLTGEVKFFEE